MNETDALSDNYRLANLPEDLLEPTIVGQILWAFECGKLSLIEYFRLVSEDVDSDDTVTDGHFVRFWIGLVGQVTRVATMIPALRDRACVWLRSNTNHIDIDHI